MRKEVNVMCRILVLLFLWNTLLNGQSRNEKFLLRSTTGVYGTSQTFRFANKNYLVQQTFGQSSVVGTRSGLQYTLRQGFIQPFIESEMRQANTEDDFNVNIETYPNPFSDYIVVDFSSRSTGDIQIQIYNIVGGLEYAASFESASQLYLQPAINTNGIYILKTIVSGHSIVSKIVKE